MGLLMVLLAMAPMLSLANGCSCMPTHPQQAFCNAQFVIRAGVLSDRQSAKRENSTGAYDPMAMFYEPSYASYDILISHVFKGSEAVEQLFGGSGKQRAVPSPGKRYLGQLHTPEMGSMCGARLRRGEKYLLTGVVMDGKLVLFSCSWFKRWHDVTKPVRHGIHGGYDCSCGIEPDFGYRADDRVACTWRLPWGIKPQDCVVPQNMCRRRDGVCEWKHESPVQCDFFKTHVVLP